MNILIADDEEDFVKFLEDRLTLKGHKVEGVYNGDEALSLLKKNKYDILFVDHNMPDKTGLELAKYIKDHDGKTAVVMITGYEEMEGFFAKATGVDEYLTKPVKMKEIDDILVKYDSRC